MSKKSRPRGNAPIDAPYQRRSQRNEDFEIQQTAVDVVNQQPDELGSGQNEYLKSSSIATEGTQSQQIEGKKFHCRRHSESTG